MKTREERYFDVVERIARACAQVSDPDRAFHSIMDQAGVPFTRRHFREVMDYGNHPSAFADLLGDAVDKFTPADWEAVVDNITYMGFRADVLERVAELKDEEQ